MKNFNFGKMFIFCIAFFLISFFIGCKSSKTIAENKTSVSEEMRDISFAIIETSLDVVVSKAEQEIKPFKIVFKQTNINRTYLSPLGFIKFEIKQGFLDSLALKLQISPVWLTITDSCRTKINHHLKNENEIVKILVDTAIRKAIVKASKIILPYQISLHKNSIGQYFSPNKLLIVSITEIEKDLHIEVVPNIAQMAEILKQLAKENLT